MEYLIQYLEENYLNPKEYNLEHRVLQREDADIKNKLELGDGKKKFIKFYKDDKLVGAIGLSTNKKETEIDIWIDNKYKNKGYGREALQTIIDEKIVSNKNLIAKINKNNNKSLNLFQSLRFKETGEEDDYIILSKKV